jgi:hypothetical protein
MRREVYYIQRKNCFFIVEKKAEILSVSDKHDSLVFFRCHILKRKECTVALYILKLNLF